MDFRTMEIDRENWNKFVIENNGLFLQSREWGEFQEKTGKKVWRLQGDDWQALVIKHDLPLGKSYLYCPGGPILKISNFQFLIFNNFWKKFIDKIREVAGREKAMFLKIEPMWELNIGEVGLPAGSPTSKYWEEHGFTKASGIQRIEKTLVLDLNKSEEQLLAEMKQKTRYNIRLAEKQGVKIRISENPRKDIDDFYRLMQDTAKRNGIRIHGKGYYEKQILHGRNDGLHTDNTDMDFRLFLAEYHNKTIAANIAVFFGNRAIYLHGGSSIENRNIMAPYLLQWEQIKEARKRECKIYDFWGIDEKKWPGITRFKKGFGGNEISYIGAHDYVFNKMWYGIYKIIRELTQMSKRKTQNHS